MKENLNSVVILNMPKLVEEGILRLIEPLGEFRPIPVQSSENNISASLSPVNAAVLIQPSQNFGELGIQTQSWLMTHFNKRIVLIDFHPQEHKKLQALIQLGVKGALNIYCDEEEIIDALRLVAMNKRFYCDQVVENLIHADEQDPLDAAGLSEREKEVLKLIAEGKKTQQIADILHVSRHTINSHRKNILRKLNLKSPAELIVFAIENNLA